MKRRWVKVLGFVLLWLFSFIVFIALTFPGKKLLERVSAEINENTNSAISAGNLNIGWDLGFYIDDIRYSMPLGGEEVKLHFSGIGIHPYYLSAIKGEPRFDFSGNLGERGEFRGRYDGKKNISIEWDGLGIDELGVSLLANFVKPGSVISGKGDLKLWNASKVTDGSDFQLLIKGIKTPLNKLKLPFFELSPKRLVTGRLVLNIQTP